MVHQPPHKLLREFNILNKGGLHSGMKLQLLDIFTYSCMNCLRSWKCLKKLHNAYRKYGLELAIIHPYEWKFEKDVKNVERAINDLKIKVPVILDPERRLIKKLGINFWPAQLLVRDGKIVYLHIGEGSYKALEGNIRNILCIDESEKKVFPTEPLYSKIPPAYCGLRKRGKVITRGKNVPLFGSVSARGSWKQDDECLCSGATGDSIFLRTKGKKIFIVARTLSKNPAIIKAGWKHKVKIIESTTKINRPTLYPLLKVPGDSGELAIEVKSGNMGIFSFTFQ